MSGNGHSAGLLLVGIGEDGIEGLSPAARALIGNAKRLSAANGTLLWPTASRAPSGKPGRALSPVPPRRFPNIAESRSPYSPPAILIATASAPCSRPIFRRRRSSPSRLPPRSHWLAPGSAGRSMRRRPSLCAAVRSRLWRLCCSRSAAFWFFQRMQQRRLPSHAISLNVASGAPCCMCSKLWAVSASAFALAKLSPDGFNDVDRSHLIAMRLKPALTKNHPARYRACRRDVRA